MTPNHKDPFLLSFFFSFCFSFGKKKKKKKEYENPIRKSRIEVIMSPVSMMSLTR